VTDQQKKEQEQQRQVDRAARVQWRVLHGILGRQAVPKSPAGFKPEPGTVAEAVGAAKLARGMSTFAHGLARGDDADRSHVATVRALCDAGMRAAARAFILGVEPLMADGAPSAIGRGLVLHSLAEYELGWQELAEVPPGVLASLVPVEAVTCGLAAGTPAAMAAVRDVAGQASTLESSALVELAGRFLVTGHPDVARELADEAERRSDLREEDDLALSALRRWTNPVPTAVPQPGQVSLGVMDYHQPDHHRASRNVGDYVQTLAMLGNLARFGETRFHGEDGIGELMAELRDRLRPGLRLPGGAADVHLTPISRDFSSGDPVPEGTWMIAFGWHLHSTFRLGFGLPYHPHLNPVFVSLHVNRVRALTPETIDYLRVRGPIGCRDWTTVDLLLSAGVDAFFTGCLTTTVDAVFPSGDDVPRDRKRVVGAVDLKPPALRKIKADKEVVTHGGAEFREASLVAGTRAAIALLERYQRRFTRVVTSRLHSYLPATSLGIPTRFRPPVPGDVRFDGLLDLTPDAPEFGAIRDGIRNLLADVHQWILAGLPEEEVYARWRQRTEHHVAEARARLARPAEPAAGLQDLEEIVARVRQTAHRSGPHDSVDEGTIADVAMTVGAALAERLLVAVESVVANARGPVRLWVTTRNVDGGFRDTFARAFPDLPVTFFQLDDLDLGDATRLLLPELLADLARVTYLDVDTITEGDVCDLARTDLHGHPFAARPDRQPGAQLWRDAGDRLPPGPASVLRRTMSARHAFDFEAVDAGVVVLDLARLRRDRFVPEFVPMVWTYGLDAREVLNAYAGPDRLELPARWNLSPLLEQVVEPGVVHFAAVGEPWQDELVPERGRWLTYHDRVAERLRRTSATPA